MKRYPPYDPVEYVEWSADPKVMREYARVVAERPAVRRAVLGLGRRGIERIYKGLVRVRLHDITLGRWVRTGVLTKAWLGQGEEAVTVGAVHALAEEDVVGPMIRNAGACFERGIPLADSFKVYLATGDTNTQGRDLHLGDLAHGVVAPVSLVGDLVPVMAGFALAFRLRREERVALTWVGEGATRTAACHEGLAVAAAERVPLIVIVQDNGVALGTHSSERLQAAVRAMPAAYAVRGLECDGNHVFDVYAAVVEARALCLKGEGPVIIYASTFRMGGHATHDEREARALFPPEVFRHWGTRDPVGCLEEYLVAEGMLDPDGRRQLMAWEEDVTAEIATAEAAALAAREAHPPDPAAMRGEVYGRPD